ncbi:EF-hand domain-containing protein [Falsiphaeobacter marinintestinus]|uniref:EF-hand domain-containing protein n=1 Tax=Falsiphaeobacter marinintestinus TaxID=1492905 RepID=UPI0011B6862E|nr:EF-hand domain-containing protein [Phaeobacter marinintestinus]
MKTLLITTAALAFGASVALADSHGAGKPGAHFVENWDLDGDGQVTLAEAEEKRADIFYMFDQDENDTLDSAEYDRFDETRKADMDANAGGHGAGHMKTVGAGLQRGFNDVDGDGAVSKAEFVERTADWFATIDTTGDGAISTDDFGRK